MSDVTNWFNGFTKVAEASGITDPAEIRKLLTFHKRAELAAKYPSQFEAGFTKATKQAQMAPQDTSLYSTPSGFASEDITPDVGHHAMNYGLGGVAGGGIAGAGLGRLLGTGTKKMPITAGRSLLGTIARLLGRTAARPSAGRWGLLGGLGGLAYGASKGKFMQGRYGEGSQVGQSPESYLNKMNPEIDRMKAIRSRLGSALGPEAGHMTSADWYAQTHAR